MKKISRVSFDSTSKEYILNALGKSIDGDGFIIESKSKKRVLTPDGEPLHSEDFGGVRHGSEIFFKNDLPSVLDAMKQVSADQKA